METKNRAEFSGKRRRENAEFEPRKSQCPPPPVETKIIDLNDDCLMDIFEQLDLRSLFNIAVANERLRPAARDVYEWKFGEKMVYIKQCGIPHETDTNNSFTLDEFEECILIYGLKSSLQFLRCFGPSISQLRVDYGNLPSKRFDHVHQYINNYCADTLTRIEFESMTNIEIEQFQKVFFHIKGIIVIGGELGRQWPTFVKCFPNLCQLCLEDVRIVDRCPEQPFEHLDKFFLQESRCIGFTMHQFAADVLNGIHHLQQFAMTVIPDDEPRNQMWALLNWIGLNPLLEELVYEFGKRELIPVNAPEVQHIVTDYPALITLNLVDYEFSANDALAVVRQLNSLQEFKCQMLKSEYEHMKTQLDDEWTAVDDDEENEKAFDDNHACVTLNRD